MEILKNYIYFTNTKMGVDMALCEAFEFKPFEGGEALVFYTNTGRYTVLDAEDIAGFKVTANIKV